MHFTSLLSLALLPSALACSPPMRRGANDTDFPSTEIGPDTPADPATTGYFINHVALNVNNLTRSVDFYTRVFGMRHMFTYRLTERFSVTYLGHSGGGRNGTGYQTTEELIRFKNNAAGKIELVHLNVPAGQKDIPGPPKQTGTFSHLGIIVPDPEETQRRLAEFGVTIYKKVGEPVPDHGYMGNPYSIGDATHLTAAEFTQIRAEMSKLNSLDIFAADPDGNLLEILPLDEPNLFN